MPETAMQVWDVVAVNLDSNQVRLLAQQTTKRNAEAIVNMAVIRRGINEEFFAEVVHGLYLEGEVWKGVQKNASGY